MRKPLFSKITFTFCIICSMSTAQNSSGGDSEAEQFFRQAIQLHNDGNLIEAIRLFEASHRNLAKNGNNLQINIACLKYMARDSSVLDNNLAALQYIDQALDLSQNRGNANDAERTELLLDKALIYDRQGSFQSSENIFSHSLLNFTEKQQRDSHLWRVFLSRLANHFYIIGKHDEAYRVAASSVDAFENAALVDENYILSLNVCGLVSLIREDQKNARFFFEKSLSIQQVINPGTLNSAHTVMLLCQIYAKDNDLFSIKQVSRSLLNVLSVVKHFENHHLAVDIYLIGQSCEKSDLISETHELYAFSVLFIKNNSTNYGKFVRNLVVSSLLNSKYDLKKSKESGPDSFDYNFSNYIFIILSKPY